MSNELRSRRSSFNGPSNGDGIGAWRHVDVDDCGQWQVGLGHSWAEPAFERAPEVVRRDLIRAGDAPCMSSRI